MTEQAVMLRHWSVHTWSRGQIFLFTTEACARGLTNDMLLCYTHHEATDYQLALCLTVLFVHETSIFAIQICYHVHQASSLRLFQQH